MAPGLEIGITFLLRLPGVGFGLRTGRTGKTLRVGLGLKPIGLATDRGDGAGGILLVIPPFIGGVNVLALAFLITDCPRLIKVSSMCL